LLRDKRRGKFMAERRVPLQEEIDEMLRPINASEEIKAFGNI
jgi:hypothetical protein